MTEFISITGDHIDALKNTVRNRTSSQATLRSALASLSYECAKNIQQIDLETKTFSTPMGVEMNGLSYKYPSRLIVSTRFDKETIGAGLSQALGCCPQGYLDFEGRRALEALNSPVRYMELPNLKGNPLNQLIIGKSVLATGCTALSLTRTALNKYSPDKLVITSFFYSEAGVNDIISEFKDVTLILTGEPDGIQSDGMLIPGLGNIDERLNM